MLAAAQEFLVEQVEKIVLPRGDKVVEIVAVRKMDLLVQEGGAGLIRDLELRGIAPELQSFDSVRPFFPDVELHGAVAIRLGKSETALFLLLNLPA